MTLCINGVTAGPLLKKLGLADTPESRAKITAAYQTRFKTHLIGSYEEVATTHAACSFFDMLFSSFAYFFLIRGNGCASRSASLQSEFL